MQAALHGSYRNPQRISRFAILQALVVDQQQGGTQLVGKVIDRRPNPRLRLFLFESLCGGWVVARQNLHQSRDIIIAATVIQAHHAVSLVASLRIDGLVGGDCVEPRSESPALLELLLFQVDLKKSCLKHVLRHLGLSEIPTEIVEQFTLVAMQKCLERRLITTLTELLEQGLIGRARRLDRRCLPGRPTPLGWLIPSRLGGQVMHGLFLVTQLAGKRFVGSFPARPRV